MSTELTLRDRLRVRIQGGSRDSASLAVLASSLMLVAAKVATMGFGFLAWVVAARTFPANEVGLASGAVSAVTLCAQFALIGAGSAVITLLPRYRDQPGALLDVSITLLTGSAVVAALIFLVFAQGILSELRVVATNPIYAVLFVLMAVAGTLGVLFDQASTARRRGHQVLVRGLVSGSLTLVAIWLVSQVAGQQTSVAIFLAWVIGGAATWGLGLLLLGRAVPGYRYRPAGDRHLAAEIVRVGLPNYLLTLTERAPGFVLPIVVVELLSPADNAHWYAAWMMAWVVFVIPIQVGMTSFAEIARDPARTAAIVGHGIRTSLVVGILGAAALGLFAGPALGLLGQGYAAAGEGPLRILVLGTIPMTIIQAYFSVCRARQRLREAIAIGTTNSVASIAIPAVAGVGLGLTGMAVAWLVVQAVTSIVAFTRLRQITAAAAEEATGSK